MSAPELDTPHPVVDDGKQTLNLDRLAAWELLLRGCLGDMQDEIDALVAGTVVDATSTIKGKLKLTNDLGGTADLPTVPGLALKAPLANPAFTGNPTAPTPSTSDNDTSLATTQFVKAQKVTDLTAPTSSFSMNSQRITNAADAINAADLTTFGQLQDTAIELANGTFRLSCAIRLTNMPTSAGSGFVNYGSEQEWEISGSVHDGVTLTLRDWVLIDSHLMLDPKERNGFWKVRYFVGSNPVLQRYKDPLDEYFTGLMGTVLTGTSRGRTYYLATANPITIGTTDIEFEEYVPLGIGASVSSLPSSPRDGETIFFRTGQDGVNWHLRYRSAAGGSYKWEFLGGPPMILEDNDARNLTNQTTFANLPTDPMSISLPALAGDYDIEVGGRISPVSAGAGYLSYAVGATAASDLWAHEGTLAALTSSVGSIRTRHTGVAASSSIAEKARTAGNYTVTYSRRRIAIWPVRVG